MTTELEVFRLVRKVRGVLLIMRSGAPRGTVDIWSRSPSTLTLG